MVWRKPSPSTFYSKLYRQRGSSPWLDPANITLIFLERRSRSWARLNKHTSTFTRSKAPSRAWHTYGCVGEEGVMVQCASLRVHDHTSPQHNTLRHYLVYLEGVYTSQKIQNMKPGKWRGTPYTVPWPRPLRNNSTWITEYLSPPERHAASEAGALRVQSYQFLKAVRHQATEQTLVQAMANDGGRTPSVSLGSVGYKTPSEL